MNLYLPPCILREQVLYYSIVAPASIRNAVTCRLVKMVDLRLVVNAVVEWDAVGMKLHFGCVKTQVRIKGNEVENEMDKARCLMPNPTSKI